MKTYFWGSFLILLTGHVFNACVCSGASVCLFHSTKFIVTSELTLEGGLKYEHIGCKIDLLYSMHCFGEPEG